MPGIHAVRFLAALPNSRIPATLPALIPAVNGMSAFNGVVTNDYPAIDRNPPATARHASDVVRLASVSARRGEIIPPVVG